MSPSPPALADRDADPAAAAARLRARLEAELAHRTDSPPEILWARPVFVRKKGTDGSLMSFEIGLRAHGDTEGHRATLRWAPIDRLRAEAARFDRHRPIGERVAAPLPPFVLDAEAACLLTVFPFDRRLPRLPHLLTPRALVRMLESGSVQRARAEAGWRVRKRKSTWSLLSYRPERRVVVRWQVSERNDRTGEKSVGNVVVRIHAAALEQESRLHDELAAAGVHAPQLLAMPSRRIRVESFVDGAPLSMRRPPSPDSLEAAAAQIARWHAHSTSMALPLRRRKDLIDQVSRARANLDTASGIDLTAFERAREELRRDTASRPGVRPLHGDAHPAQFLEGPASIAVVDWDRAALGEPAEDLGNLWTHLIGVGAEPGAPQFEALRRGYESVRAFPREEELRWHRLAAALRLLELPARQPGVVPADWCRRLQGEAERLVRARVVQP